MKPDRSRTGGAAGARARGFVIALAIAMAAGALVARLRTPLPMASWRAARARAQ